MPIGVEWQNEFGLMLARYDGPPITGDLVGLASPATVCLRFIDPYGNTIFNQWQLPILIRELEVLESAHPEGEGDALRALLAFVRKAEDRVHTYIKFIGD